MIRRFVRGVVHDASVANVQMSSWAARIDPIILRAAEILPMEEIELVNLATGELFVTWAEPGAPGELVVHQRVARAGERLAIVSYGLLHDGQTLGHKARKVTLGPSNEVLSITEVASTSDEHAGFGSLPQ